MKTCTKCGSNGPFYKDKSTKDGLTYTCRNCIRNRADEWVAKNPEQVKHNHDAWVTAHPESTKEYLTRHIENDSKAYSAKRAVYLRRSRLKTKYGITEAEWDIVFKEQNGLCCICLCNLPTNKSKCATDHDHESGKRRGILCMPCNLALGGFKDNSILLRHAVDYLEEWKRNHASEQAEGRSTACASQ